MLGGITSVRSKSARTIDDESHRDREDTEPERKMLKKRPDAERTRSQTPKADLGTRVRSKIFMLRNIAPDGSSKNACSQKTPDGPANDKVVKRTENARADKRVAYFPYCKRACLPSHLTALFFRHARINRLVRREPM
jgi:hypothetical protein